MLALALILSGCKASSSTSGEDGKASKNDKKGYSEKSVKSYTFMMKRFFEHFEHLDPAQITMDEIEDYNFEFFVSGRYSRSYQLQFINAIKLYFYLTDGIELHLKQLRRTGKVR